MTVRGCLLMLMECYPHRYAIDPLVGPLGDDEYDLEDVLDGTAGDGLLTFLCREVQEDLEDWEETWKRPRRTGSMFERMLALVETAASELDETVRELRRRRAD